MKTLRDYQELLKKEGLLLAETPENPAVAHLSYSSQDVEKETLFVCKGQHFKEEYLVDAMHKGAVAYVSEKKYDVALPCLLVSSALKALSLSAQLFYDYPRNSLKLIGITGTKGKSTTAYYVKAILDDYLVGQGKLPAAIMSSIDTDDGVERFESHITTPESLDLQRHLRNAVDSGREYCVCESSSQALKYSRLYGMRFDVGLFLNISEDHISDMEHTDMEDYFTSKLKLFEQSAVCGYHIGSDFQQRIAQMAQETNAKNPSFGLLPQADYYGYDLVHTGLGIRFSVRMHGESYPFEIAMPGTFNVENALAAICACDELGVPVSVMQEGLKNAHVSGRMEVFASENRHKIVIVDYAHNYLSFLKLYESVEKEYPGREITTLFGCAGGGKARMRRRDLGMISGLHSQRIYLTEDDPGTESVHNIALTMQEYATRNCDTVFIVDDRVEAVRRAILESSEHAIILLAGKGRETRQKRGDAYVDCPTDVAVAEETLAFYDKQSKKVSVGSPDIRKK